MKYIDDLLGGLFSNKRDKMDFKENFEVSDSQEREVALWMESAEGEEVLEKVYRNYHLKRAGINSKPEVHILTSPYANGFALTFEKPINAEIFSKLFFGFGQRMLDLGYRKVSLDRKMQEINQHVKTIEKLYFKPRLSGDDFTGKFDQLFGNVSIEKVYGQ